jgi:accessory Sec system S-layer assembly protein
MFTFFKNKKAGEVKKTGLDHTVSSNELLNQGEEPGEKEVETDLSLPSHWDLSKEDEYVFRFLHNELSPLKINQISLSGVDIERDSTIIKVTAFVRNSMPQAIRLNDAEILLLNERREIAARKKFDLSELKEIPSNSSMPWVFSFEKHTWGNVDLPETGWTLAFNLGSKSKHKLDFDATWNDKLSKKEIQTLTNVVNALPALNSNEFNITGIEAMVTKNSDLHITALFRNGNSRAIRIQKLPIEIVDGNKKIIAKATFKLDNVEVKPNTSKPWVFIFPNDLVSEENIDLNNWSIKPVLNK